MVSRGYGELPAGHVSFYERSEVVYADVVPSHMSFIDMFEDEAEVDWLQDAWLLNRRIKVTRLRCDAEGNRRSLRVMIRRVEVCGLLLIK